MPTTTLKIKVIPNSSTNAITGWIDDALKVKLMAPPEDGKANKALVQLLSKQLKIAQKHIKITAGLSTQIKTLLINSSTSIKGLPDQPSLDS